MYNDCSVYSYIENNTCIQFNSVCYIPVHSFYMAQQLSLSTFQILKYQSRSKNEKMLFDEQKKLQTLVDGHLMDSIIYLYW